MKSKQNQVILLILGVATTLLIIAYFTFWHGGDNSLVVYCTHDSVYSDRILKQFEQKTGIRVIPKYDTEATKSLGLVELLVKEKDNPRCDVFWNNEILGIIDLKEKGVLQSYKGKGYARIPTAFKDPEGYWTGFGSRMRIYIVNTEKCPAKESEIDKRMHGDLSNICIAKPLYGTTLTHYCCLWEELGEKNLKQLHEERQKKGLKILNSNGATKNAVAEGVCDFGWTDTDDFFLAKDAGKPVEMLPVRLKNGETICIPNTVAIIKGTKKLDQAKKLVDFLLSEECELALANSKSRQIPLGPVDETKLSPDVKKLKEWTKSGHSLNQLSEIRAKCIKWLKSIYAK